MSLYNGNLEQYAAPLSQFQNSTDFMQYYLELLHHYEHDQRMLSAPKPVKEVRPCPVTVDEPSKEDDFMMYQFKVRRCPTGRGHHDWTDCHYLHPGEKARRRDLRKYSYSGKPCANFRKNGQCENGDKCHFAHGVFETWLHPDKYKTQMCRDGRSCERKVCFFAHFKEEMREGDNVIQDVSNLVSPKSVLDEHQSPSPSPPRSPDVDITQRIERLRLSSGQNIANGAQNIANGAQNVANSTQNIAVSDAIGRHHANHNLIYLKPEPITIETVQEPDIDWIVQLVD